MGRCWPVSAGVSEQAGEMVVSLCREAVEAIAAASMRCCVATGTLLGTESKQPPSLLLVPAVGRAKQEPAGEGNMLKIEIIRLGFLKPV